MMGKEAQLLADSGFEHAVITHHFTGPDRPVGTCVCVCVCVFGQYLSK